LDEWRNVIQDLKGEQLSRLLIALETVRGEILLESLHYAAADDLLRSQGAARNANALLAELKRELETRNG
jgi:hypothetical protein